MWWKLPRDFQLSVAMATIIYNKNVLLLVLYNEAQNKVVYSELVVFI